MMKYPGTDLQTYNLDWLISEVKRLAKANGIEFNDENIHIGADNVQEAIDALYDLIMEISGQTNAVEVIDSSIVESTWSTGYTYTHLQTVNTPTLMAIVNAMRLGKAIILRRDIATNDEAAFVLLEVTYDPILFKHELKLVNPYIHKVATLDIFGLDDDANVYVQILPDVTIKYVNTFNGRSGNITPQTSDYDAVQIDYDNTGTGLAATNVQSALNEIKGDIPTTLVSTFNGRSGTVSPTSGDYTASQITYDNTTSGLSATDAQAAIDELVANPVMPDAVDVPYNNADSGLQATNVQAALDEIVDDVLSSGVASFNGRTGAVNPAAHDYDAGQIDYDNTTSGLSATDAQSAIDELASDIEDLSAVTPQTSTGNPISITTDAAQVARDTKITLSPIQASGTPTPADPIPIYGRDNIKLKATRKNLIDADDYYGSFKVGVNSYSGPIGQLHLINIPVGDYIGIQLTFSMTIACNANTPGILAEAIIGGQAVTGTLVSPGTTGSTVVTFTPASPSDYVRLTYGAGGEYDSDYSNIQLELGASATAYEAFTAAANISQTLPETVYGGELDVETGVLKVTDRMVDLGDLVWNALDADGGYYTDSLAPAAKNTQNALCSDYKNAGSSLANLVDLSFVGDNNGRIYLRDRSYVDATALTIGLTGVKFVCERETPITIQLTPYEVELLQGTNVITTNGSSITIVWREGVLATLADIPSETVNKIAGLMVTQTAGELNEKINANQTAAAVLSNLMLRDCKFQTTTITPGDDATEPDGTLIIVYEA